MSNSTLLHIALIYLVAINVVTFFMYGIDKWEAKRSKWRISEATLLGMAVIGGSIGAWLGMNTWHHKTLHKKFRHGVPLILIAQIALFFLCSCRTAAISSHQVVPSEQSISTIADKVWTYSQSHPDGFTLDIRTMTEPQEGIAVSYAATQNHHSRSQLESVISHALQNDGYVGGWYNREDGLYYFDSSRLFPEDKLNNAIQFGKEYGHQSVYRLSSSTEIPIIAEHSPSVLIVMYDQKIGKEPLLKAVNKYKAEIIYDYSIIPGMAIKKPDSKTLEETMQYFKKVKGVVSVEYDHVYHLTDSVKPDRWNRESHPSSLEDGRVVTEEDKVKFEIE